jgi:Outer membrane protein beta-barrel domain
MRQIRIIACLLAVVAFSSIVSAQSRGNQERTATVTMAAPVFLEPNTNREPLRVAREGSILVLDEVNGDWCRVQFQDPEYGRRTGFIQTRFVRIDEREPARNEPESRGPRDSARAPSTTATDDQQATDDGASFQKSYASKFFIGVGYEGNAIASTEPGAPSETESGRGFGIVLGYGFNPHFSLYGELTGASINAITGGTYTLAHVDIGTRLHFLAGPSRAVPFIQVGLSARGINGDVVVASRIHSITASGTGVAFGGGVNIHFTPSVAFSPGVTWSTGNFSTYEVDNISVQAPKISAMSARVHLGLVWFAKAP